MRIPLDRQSDIPLYLQIKTHLREAILSGGLGQGTRLPSVRGLAGSLGVNRLTIETAYAELEADGLVYARVGSGTYVLPHLALPPPPLGGPAPAWPGWQEQVRMGSAGASAPQPDDLLRAAGHPQPLSFAGGAGDPHLFPVTDFRRVLQTVLKRDGAAGLEYGERAGYAPLRETIARVLVSQGVPARPENILITGGSQQAIALVAQLLLRPGDWVLVERPTYSTGLELFRALGLRIATIPTDEQGMQVEALENILQTWPPDRPAPKLIYTIPNFHNPTGVCLSGQRRRQLLALAGRRDIPLLEDDFVGDLRFEGRAQPALKSLDPGGRVIYISTFSKMLMPGLRVGFLAAEGPVYAGLVDLKRTSDLATSGLTQRALEAYVSVGSYQSHLHRTCQLYRKRRDAMLQAIRRHLPDGVRFEAPQGGLFVWLRLPAPLSATDLLRPACAAGVSFAPGPAFFAGDERPPGSPPAGDDFLRLNFACLPPEQIEAGIARLGKVIRSG